MWTRMQLLLGFVILFIISPVGSTLRSKRSKNPIRQWPVPDPRKTPSPCRCFVWDMGSAKRFCTCTRLLKGAASTSLWQDSHEHFWLRISRGSPLLELFPCQKHSLSRCVRCGHDFGAHVRAALEDRPSRPFEQLMKVSPAVGGEEIPLEFRKVASSGDAARHADAKQESEAVDNGARDADNKVARNGGRRGRAKWAKGLALVAEAQRTSTIQLSGIGVTSASVQSGFDEVRRKMAEKVKAEETRVRKEEDRVRRRRTARVPERSTKAKGDGGDRRGRLAAEGGGRGGTRSSRSSSSSNNSNSNNAFMRDLVEFVQTYKRVLYP